MSMKSIVEQAKHDPDAFCQLYDRYSESSYRYAYFRVNSQQDAEDLVSSAWEKVLKKIGTFQSSNEKAFCAWLFQIIRNEIIDWYRKKNQKTLALDEELDTAESTEVNEATFNETQETLMDLFHALTHQQQEVLGLRFFADLKNKEIALQLGYSEDAVASHISRGLKILRQRMKKLP